MVRITVRLVAALFFVAAVPSLARAEACLPSLRTVKFPDGSTKLKSYVCTLDRAKSPQVRVEFYRLKDIAAGGLVEGDPYPLLRATLGTPRLERNAVGAELKKLFDEFGSKSEEESCYRVAIAAAGEREPFVSVEGAPGADHDCALRRTIWSLDFSGSTYIPLPAVERQIYDQKDWPSGFNFFYAGDCSKDDSILCTLLWRAATRNEVEHYAENYKTFLESLPKNEENSSDLSSFHDRQTSRLAMIPYLMRDKWVDDFLFVTGSLGSCGDDIEVTTDIGGRELVLDIAFITNISGAPLAVEGLLGNSVEDTTLRTEAEAAARIAERKPEMIPSPQVLKVSESVAVPLRISFPFALDTYDDTKVADRIYRDIQKAAAGEVFVAKDEYDPPIQKLRESFGPPISPPKVAYVYGPEFVLKGIQIAGHTLDLAEASRNLVEISDDPGYGSCPYLYSWDDRDEVWVKRGKVIDDANGKSKEATQRIAFQGFRGKFRLAEEEPELSHIDSAVLEIELADGGGMTLRPANSAIAEQDGSYATVYAHESIVFDFALPRSVKREDVKRSTLAITGYYRRYSDLLMARQ